MKLQAIHCNNKNLWFEAFKNKLCYNAIYMDDIYEIKIQSIRTSYLFKSNLDFCYIILKCFPSISNTRYSILENKTKIPCCSRSFKISTNWSLKNIQLTWSALQALSHTQLTTYWQTHIDRTQGVIKLDMGFPLT